MSKLKASMKKKFKKYAGQTCQDCRKKFPKDQLTIHHLSGRKRTLPSNIEVLCRSCHDRVHGFR